MKEWFVVGRLGFLFVEFLGGMVLFECIVQSCFKLTIDAAQSNIYSLLSIHY